MSKYLSDFKTQIEKMDTEDKPKNIFVRVYDSIFGIVGLVTSPLLLVNPFFWLSLILINDIPNQMMPEPGHQNDKGLFW